MDFRESVHRFVTLYNRHHTHAYRFTYPYFELTFLKSGARSLLSDTQNAEAFRTTQQESHARALAHAEENVNFLQPFRGETTKYEILSIDEENLTSRFRAGIPTRNTTNDELLHRNRTITVKWFQHDGH